jgi:hypothetical protein
MTTAFQSDAFQIETSWPLPGQVLSGVHYGPDGNNYTGTLESGSGYTPSQIADAVWSHVTATSIISIIEFLLKSIKNKREVKKVGSTWILFIYDNDGVTPILQKNVKDITLSEISDLVNGVLSVEEATVV